MNQTKSEQDAALSSLPNKKKRCKIKILTHFIELTELEWSAVETPHYEF
jgi:hypothetical protein